MLAVTIESSIECLIIHIIFNYLTTRSFCSDKNNIYKIEFQAMESLLIILNYLLIISIK